MYDFPRQNIPEKDKNKDWCKSVIESILRYYRYNTRFTYERKKEYENYLIYNGIFDVKQFQYVTDAYGITAPARLVNYPIIAPKIDLLIGEFISQPLRFSVTSINEDAVSRKLDKKVTAAAEQLLRPVRAEIAEVTGIELQEEEYGLEVPEDVDEFNRMDFREHTEDMIYNGLNYLIQKKGLKDRFKRGLYDLCITSKEFYHVSIKSGDPHIRNVDPRTLIYDIQIDREDLEDAMWVLEERLLTIAEAIDEFGDWLNDEQIDTLEELQRTMNTEDILKYNSVYTWYHIDAEGPLKIRVLHAEWKSIRKVKVKISPNKYDPERPYRKIMPDDYKPKKNEKIETKHVVEVWEATRIGHEIMIKCRKKPNQFRREDFGYANTKLDYVGCIKANLDGYTTSIVDALKNIQLLYNIVLYHIELAIARTGGKAVVYDTAQKPPNMDLATVLFHVKNSGIIPINSKLEGNQAATFNQFQQVDFTLSNSIQQLINLKVMLEDMAEQLTGITASRQGFTSPEAAVGTTKSSVIQSSLITAPLFYIHSKVMERVFNRLADLMKTAWSGKKATSYWMGDAGFKFFELDDSVTKDDYGVFVEVGNREWEKLQTMRQMGQIGLQSGSLDFLGLMKVINAETAKEAEILIERGVEEVRAMQQQQMEAQAQASQAESQDKHLEREKDVEVARMGAESRVRAAKITADAKLGTEHVKQESMQDIIDVRTKRELDKQMLDASNEEAKEGKAKSAEKKEKPKGG